MTRPPGLDAASGQAHTPDRPLPMPPAPRHPCEGLVSPTVATDGPACEAPGCGRADALPYQTGPQAGCERHHGLCACTGTEPGRCPVCHTTWERAGSCDCKDCGNSREHHLAVHERRDQAEARYAARRASQARHGPAGHGGAS
jgi:hypothetical protein